MNSNFKRIKSLIFQILLVIILFTIVFVLLRQANLIKFPGFIEKLFYKEQEITQTEHANEQEIFEYISNYADIPEIQAYPTITVENMNTLLNSLSAYENFYWESVSETFSTSTSIQKSCKSRISGNRYNTEISKSNDSTIKKYVCNGVDTLVTTVRNGKASDSVYSKGIFDFYSDAGLISIEYFKDYDFSEGLCEIHHINNNQYNLVSVEYTYERNGVNVTNIYGISLDFGVVLFAECYENDILVFKQSTNSIYPLSSLDDKIFNVN